MKQMPTAQVHPQVTEANVRRRSADIHQPKLFVSNPRASGFISIRLYTLQKNGTFVEQ